MVPKESWCPCLPALLRGQHPGLTVLPGLEFLPSVAVFMTFWSILGDDYPFLGIYKNTSYTAAWSLSRVRLCDSMDCIDHQAPLSMGFPRQKHWSGLPFPSPGNVPNSGPRKRTRVPGIAGGFFTAEPLGKPHSVVRSILNEVLKAINWGTAVLCRCLLLLLLQPCLMPPFLRIYMHFSQTSTV